MIDLLDRHHHLLRRFGSTTTVAQYPPDRAIEPTDLAIHLTVDLEGRSAAGAVTHTVVGRRAGARHLRLDAVDLEDVQVDGGPHPLTWRYDGRAIAITWAEAFATGETRRVTITYQVTEPTTGILFSAPSPAIPGAPWFAVVDNETERARHWLPCIDHPSVRPTLSFELRAASRWTILANGRCTGEETQEDGTTISRWRLDRGCPSYLTCFAIGEFIRVDDGEVDGVEIAYFVSPTRDAAALRRSFGRTPAMLRWLQGHLAYPFPFPKYYQFAVPGIGGAMENISLVSWDDLFVVDEALHAEIGGLVDRINIHEMAHAYFGDLVVIRDFCDAWLKESWAVYIEACWLEHREGEDAMRYLLWECLQRYLDEADNRYTRPIVSRRFDSSWELFDAHLYPGGAVRLHMLRKELGDPVFWAATRDYIQRYAGGLVETDDLRRCFEHHSGRSLARFFEQWLRSPGYPKLKINYRRDSEAGLGHLIVEQTQVDADKGIPCFDLDLDVEWEIAGERQRRTLRIDRPRQSLAIPLPEEPTALRIDPEARLVCALDFNPGGDLLRRQLREAGDVTGRILAGRELIKTGSRGNLAAIADAWASEPFWGVRVAWAQALATANHPRALTILCDALERELDPRVLPPLFQALGRYRDPRVVAALRARIDRGGLGHRALAAAYEALGAQRHHLHDPELAELTVAATRPSFAGLATAGALRGLATSRAANAAKQLQEALSPGSACGEPARPTAALALGGLARVLATGPRESAIDHLLDGLRDPNERVREAALAGLRLAGATHAADAIDAYARTLTDQLRIPHQRVADTLRRGATDPEGKLGALEREVTKLQEELRRLREALGDLEAKERVTSPEPDHS